MSCKRHLELFALLNGRIKKRCARLISSSCFVTGLRDFTNYIIGHVLNSQSQVSDIPGHMSKLGGPNAKGPPLDFDVIIPFFNSDIKNLMMLPKAYKLKL